MLSFLNQYKTYIIGILAILGAVGAWWGGKIDMQALIAAIIAALGGMSIQHSTNVSTAKALKSLKPLIVVALMLALATGCTNQAAQLQPQIIAGSVAVATTDGLLLTNSLSVAHAKAIYKAGLSADGAFQQALASIKGGGTPTQTVVAEILGALQTMSTELQSTPAGQAASAKMKTRLARLASADPKKLTGIEIAALIDLAVQMFPEVVHVVTEVMTGSDITTADCQTSLTTFETNLAKLQADIAAKGG